MQVVYFVISFIEIILTCVVAYYLIKTTRTIDAINSTVSYKIKKLDQMFDLIAIILDYSAKAFKIYGEYKNSIKEFKSVLNAFLTVKKLIDTYSFLSSLAAIKKLSFILVLKKLLFKKR